MKPATAWAVMLLIVASLTLCELVVCPQAAAADTSCCHKSQSHSGHCPPKSAQDCPYSILERGKTSSTIATAPPAAVVQPDQLVTAENLACAPYESYPADSAKLFLSNRVLRI